MKKLALLLKLVPCLCIGVLIANPDVAHAASLLDFDGFQSSTLLPEDYGSNLPGTPNIQVQYRTLNPTTLGTWTNYLGVWTLAGYGDLEDGVAYPVTETSVGEIFLIPEDGYAVTLFGFDLAGWLGDSVAQTVRVLDEEDRVLFELPSVDIEGDAGHSSLSLNITHAGTIKIQFGPSWNTGIDNISFAQDVVFRTQLSPVPVPTPALIPGLIGLGLTALRKRKLEAES